MAASTAATESLLHRAPRGSEDSDVRSPYELDERPSLEQRVSSQEDVALNRSIEQDVVPETAVLGRNLGWGSAIAGPIFAWCGLSVILEYGCMLPRSGGDKVYLEFTYRRPRYLATTLVTVHFVVLGFTAANCIVFAEYVLYARGGDASEAATKFVAAGLLTIIIFVHSCFLKTGIFIQNCIGWVKIALVGLMVLTSLFAVFFHPKGLEEDNHKALNSTVRRSIWEGSNWELSVISSAFFKVWYSYNGLQNVNYVLNEVKNPVKTLKSVAPAALLSACVLYFLVNVAYFLIVPLEEIKNSGELIAALFFERLFGSHAGGLVMSLAVATSTAGNVMVATFGHARIIQEIAREGFLPFSNIVSSTRPFNAPMGALVVHYIPTLLVILLPAGDIYSFVVNVQGYSGQFVALAGAVGLLWLRYKRPELQRPYRAFISAACIQIVLSIALIVAPFVPYNGLGWTQRMERMGYALMTIAVLLFGVLYWYVWTVLLPRWKGYRLEEEAAVLDDGTVVTQLVKVPG